MGNRITDSILARTALGDLSRLRARFAETQEQAASGLRINRPSDDPVGATAALALREALDANAQFQRNVSGTRARVRSAASALSSANDILIRARELAVAGANDTQDAGTRAQVAEEVEALHERLLADANTRSGGSYVFAGFASDSAPFTRSGPFVDGSPSPSVSFGGTNDEITVGIDEGVRVRATLDGERVFQGGTDLFAVLGDLRDALQSNNPAGIRAALPALEQAQAQIASARTEVGSIETQLDTTERRLADREVDLEQQLSLTQDADSFEVFSRLARQESALQAALQASSRMLQPSLLDFLA